MKQNLFKSIILVTGVAMLTAAPVYTEASTCTSVTTILSYGMSGDQVLSLQNYLKNSGFFFAAPTGYFGPVTEAALRAFQSANGITPTGQTGPLTRAAISRDSCQVTSTNLQTNPDQVNTSIPVQTPSDNIGITSPAMGQILSIGSSTVIRWNSSISGQFNIVLEQPGGIGAGFVALNQMPNTDGNQYVWKIGKVYSSQTSSDQIIPAGTYRLRIQRVSAGSSPSDQVSGWFTISVPQLAVSSVIPSSAYADNATSIVLFGSGFNAGTSVYFDTYQSGVRANIAYTSPDGTVLVFTVPTNVEIGAHTLYVGNNTGSPLVTVPFTVNSIN